MRRSVLGIDVASGSWRSVGSARIDYDDATGRSLCAEPGAISWPKAPLTPTALGTAIDDFARKHEVVAVALDGPQAWRDPATATSARGVGRRCEYECRTQGKTGVHPTTYPRTQRAWIEFSVELFDDLLARPGVALASGNLTSITDGGYAVLECFPTSTWRTSGLTALPGKAKRPALAPYIAALASAYDLPRSRPRRTTIFKRSSLHSRRLQSRAVPPRRCVAALPRVRVDARTASSVVSRDSFGTRDRADKDCVNPPAWTRTWLVS